MGLLNFLPREEQYFDLFIQMTHYISAAARELKEMLADKNHDYAEYAQRIKGLEHACDELTHNVSTRLNKSFITPFDREDIYSLTKSLDDVLDSMDHVADLLVLYHIEKLEDGMTMLLEVTRRAVSDIHKSIHTLRDINYDKVREHIVSVHAMENEGDRLYRHFIGTLYAEERDAIRLMKYSSVYNELEHTIDTCEDLMNSIESIVLKQA